MIATRNARRRSGLRPLTAALGLAAALAAMAPAAAEPAHKSASGAHARPVEVERYCAKVAPSIEEARIAWRMRRLATLETQLDQRITALETAERGAHDWVERRERLLKSATDDVVTIYAKMDPETAAAQLAVMDEGVATAILARLKPNAASAILNQMPPERASRLAAFLAGAGAQETKS